MNRQKILKAKKLARILSGKFRPKIDWRLDKGAENILDKVNDCENLINEMGKSIYGKGKEKLMTYRNFMLSQGNWIDLDLEKLKLRSTER